MYQCIDHAARVTREETHGQGLVQEEDFRGGKGPRSLGVLWDSIRSCGRYVRYSNGIMVRQYVWGIILNT